MVKLAILGAGRIARAMADTLRQMGQAGDRRVELYAVAARDGARAEAFAREYGIAKAYGSYEEMLSDPEVQLVYIATPHSHHYAHGMLCVEHGKHVLCEKAFTVNARQAERLLQAGRERGLLVTEAIWNRYQPMSRMIREAVASGIIGEPRMIVANLCCPTTQKARILDPALAGGALLDVGVYALNFAEMVFGWADGVQASCVWSDTGVDLADSITLTWKDGRVAMLQASAEVVSDRSGSVCGTHGYLVVENLNNPQVLRIYNEEHQLVEERHCPPQFTGYEYEVLEAASCIEQGLTQCPSMPHRETVHIMELMDHIRAQWGLHYPNEEASEPS